MAAPRPADEAVMRATFVAIVKDRVRALWKEDWREKEWEGEWEV